MTAIEVKFEFVYGNVGCGCLAWDLVTTPILGAIHKLRHKLKGRGFSKDDG